LQIEGRVAYLHDLPNVFHAGAFHCAKNHVRLGTTAANVTAGNVCGKQISPAETIENQAGDIGVEASGGC